MRKRVLTFRGGTSVRAKFTLVLLLVALIPMALITFRNDYDSRQVLLLTSTSQLVGHANLQAASLDAYLSDHLTSVRILASLPGVAAYVQEPAANRTTAALDTYAAATAIAGAKDASAFFVDKQGRAVLTTAFLNNSQDYSQQSFFRQAIAGNDAVQEPTWDANSGQYFVYFASPIRSPQGQIGGVAVLSVPAADLQQLLATDANVVAPGSFGVLLDRDGIRIADGSNAKDDFSAVAPLTPAAKQALDQQQRFPAAGPAVLPAPQLANLIKPLTAAGAAAHAAINPGTGPDATTIAAAVRLHAKDWTYVELEPQAAFFALPNAELHRAILWLGAITAAIIILSILLARWFTSPLSAIATYLRRVRSGDYESRLTVRRRDEFGRLATDINATVDRLTQLLRTSEQKDAMQNQIEKLLDEVSAVAQGDLRVEAEVTAGALGSVADSFNYMIEELRRIIGAVQATTVEVSASAMQLRHSSELLAAGSNRQSVQIAETSEAVRSMDDSIQRVADQVDLSRQVAEQAVANAQRGGEAVAKTIASMGRIRINVQETAKKVKRLGESSQEIGDIVKLIEDIADKTDLLALNAAIQAELAGEHGRGFAVLAEEVRRLAERATASTKQIATLVKSIQSETQEAVTAMEESTREVVGGSLLADAAGQALLAIDHVMAQLAESITAISQATTEQAQASARIATTMQDISEVTSQTDASTREAAEKVGYLDQMANRLRVSVAAFQLPENQNAA